MQTILVISALAAESEIKASDTRRDAATTAFCLSLSLCVIPEKKRKARRLMEKCGRAIIEREGISDAFFFVIRAGGIFELSLQSYSGW